MNKIGRPRTETEAVTLRLPKDVIVQIDEFRRSEDDIPTRPEMIRRILLSWIEQNSKK